MICPNCGNTDDSSFNLYFDDDTLGITECTECGEFYRIRYLTPKEIEELRDEYEEDD